MNTHSQGQLELATYHYHAWMSRMGQEGLYLVIRQTLTITTQPAMISQIEDSKRTDRGHASTIVQKESKPLPTDVEGNEGIKPVNQSEYQSSSPQPETSNLTSVRLLYQTVGDRVEAVSVEATKLLLLERIFYEGTILILIPLYVAAFEGLSIAVCCDGVFSFGEGLSLERKA